MQVGAAALPRVFEGPDTTWTLPAAVGDRIAAVGEHTLVIDQQGALRGWGRNNHSQATAPGHATAIVSVAAGDGHSVALRADGTVVAWGANGYGQASPPPEATGCIAIAAGSAHALALRADGRVVAWGRNSDGQCDVPAAALSQGIAIAAGYRHRLALRADGRVIAWGYDGFGQCRVPPDLQDVVAIAAGGENSLAWRGDGSVVIWGWDAYRQSTLPPPAPVAHHEAGWWATRVSSWIPRPLGWLGAALGDYHSIVWRGDGQVIAWGWTGYGLCAVPASAQAVVMARAARLHTVAVRVDGSVIAWGDNSHEQTAVPAGLTVALDLPLTLTVQERDAAGNWSPPATATIVVDTLPPFAPQLEAPALTADPQPTWRWRSGGSGGSGWFRWRLDDQPWHEGDATAFIPAAALADGAHTLTVQERDAAGNWSPPASATITVTTQSSSQPRAMAAEAGRCGNGNTVVLLLLLVIWFSAKRMALFTSPVKQDL
ncbi:MAG: hypothetical protein N3B15_05400 [Planctomycetota bacterium]|nr:hypothetical protein [Planctomycetota bacterium]